MKGHGDREQEHGEGASVGSFDDQVSDEHRVAGESQSLEVEKRVPERLARSRRADTHGLLVRFDQRPAENEDKSLEGPEGK